MLKRCDWCQKDALYQDYHDTEWGVPLHDHQKLFEFLILEGQQAGLSWHTVLKKREHYRKVLDDFNPQKMATYNTRKTESLLQDPGIIRNRLKVQSLIQNARAYLKLQELGENFNDYVWSFTEGKVVHNTWKSVTELPLSSKASQAMSKDLKQRGFNFVGETICYAYMQAIGMVNDHIQSCFRYSELKA